MQTAIEITIPDLPPQPPSPFTLTALGMEVVGRPTVDQWADFGEKLYRLRTGLQWAIGDWLNYGESRADWGEKYDQALSRFDYDLGYLRNMASIARQFPSSRRVTDLTWSHHQAVSALPLPEQKKVLAKAITQKLSRDDVRIEVKLIKAKLNLPVTPLVSEPPPLPESVHILLPDPPVVSGPCAPIATAAVRITGAAGRQVFFEFEDETIVQQLWRLWQANKGKDLVMTLTRKDQP